MLGLFLNLVQMTANTGMWKSPPVLPESSVFTLCTRTAQPLGRNNGGNNCMLHKHKSCATQKRWKLYITLINIDDKGLTICIVND